MIGVDSPSPLDLRFRLGPIPVRVGFMFWLIMALLGFGFCQVAPGTTWVNLLIWLACGFLSILVHELGHALAFRAFGSWSAITLHGFGGYAEAPEPPRAAWQRMLVALAGPAAGFTLCGVAFALRTATAGGGLPEYARNALNFLFVMNLFWNLFNLLPVLPFDGGRVFREGLQMAGARNPDALAHGVSFALALVLGVYGGLRLAGLIPAAVYDALPDWFVDWVRPGMFMSIWFILLAVENFQQMQIAGRRRYYSPSDDYDDDTPPWRRR
jgi:stage IV sporulation protein FB